MCCPHNSIQPMEDDPGVSTESSKRKRRKSADSISRHKRTGKAKSVKPGAVQNVFPNQPMSFAEPPSIVVPKKPSQAQRLKSIRNRLDYERRKGSQMVEQLADSKDKLHVANDHISDLQHANK